MIPNITRNKQGEGMTGLMLYLVGPGRGNEHERPHLVAGDVLVTAWHQDEELSKADAIAIARVLDQPRKAHGTEVSGGSVWHCSLSLRADEGRLSDEKWGQIAREVMAGMGFDDPESGVSPCRWAAVHHGLSEAGNDHIHLAVSLVRENGSAANVFRDYRRVQKLARELEERHGLEQLEVRGQRAVSQAELAIARREGRPEPVRRTVERRVRAAAAGAADEAEFVSRLRADGLKVWPWFAKGRTDVVEGYSVQLPGEGQRKWGGGTLAPDLTLPRLRAGYRWGDPDRPVESAQAAHNAAAAWRGARAESWGRPARRAVKIPPQEWHAAAEELGRMVEWLSRVPAEDTAGWAVAATDAAGVFAALSRAVEGDRPGPLARAADSLARTGEIPAWQARVRPADMPTTRSAARLVASASRGGTGSVAESALLIQLRNTAKAIHDMHVARHEAQQAGRIATAAGDGLAPLLPAPAPAPNATPRPGVAAVMERPRTQTPGPTREGRGR